MGELASLRGLGPKSELQLNAIGIYTHADLARLGAVRTYLRLQQTQSKKLSLNFLYALVGAIEDRAWTDIAKQDKQRLLLELDGHADLARQLAIESQTGFTG